MVDATTILKNAALKVYLVYANAVKGISALQLSRDLGVQYKTAFVLAHKIRESSLLKGSEMQFQLHAKLF